MNKVITVSVAALMVAGIAGAQESASVVGMPPASDKATPKISAEAAVLSAYVWRGQVLNNDFVAQPQLTISQYDVSLNIWGNYDLKENVAGNSGNFSELDFSLAYTLPVNINELSFDVGLINYNFPNSGAPSTSEIYGSATVTSFQDLTVPIIPSVTVFGDINEVHGTYVLFDVNAPYKVTDVLSVKGGVSAGYGNTAYNSYYWAGPADAGWNDYNFYGLASYQITDGVTVSANLTYTMLQGGAIRDAAANTYEAKQKLWGGFNIAYDF